ncbi:MAG TPA: PAS domain-containing protein, partial [Vicinamibacteria bacterium]
MAVQGRKKTELLEEVRKLQDRLEHLSAATAEGVFLHEAGRIVHLNRSGATMFGYRPEELFGRSIVDLSPSEERAVVLARIASGREGPWETKGLKK